MSIHLHFIIRKYKYSELMLISKAAFDTFASSPEPTEKELKPDL